MDQMIDDYDSEQLKSDVPEFHVGDTVRVSTRIIEGEKERIQVFQGTVIARKGGGLSETFSLHRISYSEGMERVFYLHSPRITEIVVVKKGDVRRAKLYYLRGTTGKAAKVKEKIGARPKKQRKKAIDNEVTKSEVSAHAEEIPEPVETATQGNPE
ncbi:MAG: hypothetical protein S4CHLAM81_00340 [Chlamydiales bacterium]|nr:hypothetical protein [Chlamydiales bacterium]MCH9634836.1 hypothetical protein [Chlamydiales bacterium]MCH9703669.1 50S ribosomal protein L19 [Chlamydiota bacterium]